MGVLQSEKEGVGSPPPLNKSSRQFTLLERAYFKCNNTPFELCAKSMKYKRNSKECALSACTFSARSQGLTAVMLVNVYYPD